MDVEGVLKRLGIEHETHGDEAVALCPMHESRTGRPDTNPSWNINVVTGLHICWSCKYKGSLYRLVADVLGLVDERGFHDWDKAREWIGGDAGPIVLPDPAYRRRVLRPTGVSEAEYLSFDEVSEEMAASRGLTTDTCSLFGVRARGSAFVIPIRYHDGAFLGWQEKDGPKVRNRPVGVRKGLTLFGIDQHLYSDSPVVVVESPLDAALCHQHGFPSVALFGSSATEEQIGLMSHLSPILALDNDPAGRAAQEELSRVLDERGVRHRLVDWDGKTCKDFGDDPSLIRPLVSSAVDPLMRKLKGILR